MIDDKKVSLKSAIVMALMGVLVGLAVSKYSAKVAYDIGFSIATNQIDQEQELRWQHFEKHRMESCLAWWFNDSGSNIKAAQFYMCQNRRKWQ